MRPVIAFLLLPALGACGVKTDLQPQAGQTLPVTPYGRGDQPKAADLTQTPPQAAPKRNVELRERSEEREDDPFDLPPEE